MTLLTVLCRRQSLLFKRERAVLRLTTLGLAGIFCAVVVLTPPTLAQDAAKRTPPIARTGDPVPSAETATQIELTEQALLFPTVAARSADGKFWVVPVQAWVHVPARSRVRKAAAETLLKRLFSLDVSAANREYFDRRVDLLFADNKGGRRVTVAVAGQRFQLGATAANGHVFGEIRLLVGDITAATANGPLMMSLVLPHRDVRQIAQPISLVEPQGVSIISDIDDTVKVSYVTDRARLMRKTFLEPFEAADGMARLLRRIAGRDRPVHYVSSSPWHLAEPLMEFMAQSDLPLGELQLKHIRLKDSTIFDLLKSAELTKPPQINAILARFPARRFVLIGDAGEADPEIYGAIARQHGGRIAKILIRDCCPGKVSEARLAKAFIGLPTSLWQVFTSPDEVTFTP